MLSKIWKSFLYLIFFFFAITSIEVIIFRFLPLPSSSFIIQKYFKNSIELNNQVIHYDWTPINKISNSMKLAVIAAEDQKFTEHFGFDFDSITKALTQNTKRKIKRGASTITQQVAKNMFLWSDKSFVRKGIEVYFTLLIEVFWSKERIIEVYLNIAEFGNNVYGIQSAAKKFYKMNAIKLNRRNSASLAAILPNPKRYNVNAPTLYIQRRITWIQRQMNQLGEEVLKEL